MLYEKYERFVRRNLTILKFIRQYRALLISIASVALFSVSGYGLTKGIVYDVDFPEILVYGETFTIDSKALFSTVGYQFRCIDETSWSSTPPRRAGTYQVKITTKQLFDQETVTLFDFTIVPKTIDIVLEETQWAYGDTPRVRADLVDGDVIADVVWTFEDLSHASTMIDMESISILDSTGNDVTTSYQIRFVRQPIAFVPRLITIGVTDHQQVYDGQSITSDRFEVLEGSLISGHIARVVEQTHRTEVGVVENVLRLQIRNENDIDVTENYDLTYVYGQLEVLPNPLSLQPKAAVSVYDGSELTTNEFVILSGELVSNHRLEIQTSGHPTTVGVHANAIVSARIFDGVRDVTANYALHFELGSLEVTPRLLTVETMSGQKVYDGTALSNPHGAVVTGTLLTGHRILILDRAEQTAVGIALNTLRLEIRDDQDRDVTFNYAISFVHGSLEVTPLSIGIQTGSLQKEYDGTPIESKSHVLFFGALAFGHTTVVQTFATRIHVGETENLLTFQILDALGVDVSANYDLTLSYGTLTITQRSITIRPRDVSKVYDASALTGNEAVVLLGELVAGHVIEIETSARQTLVGVVSNPILSLRILDGLLEVTENYLVQWESGSLEVLPRPITIQPRDGSKVYDGLNFVSSDPYVLLGSLVDGHHLELITSGSDKTVGIHSNSILEARVWWNDLEVTDQYAMTFTLGSLVITKRPITIQPYHASKMYDGSPLRSLDALILVGNLVGSHRIEISVGGSQTNVGSSTSAIIQTWIWDENTDVTANYDIHTESGLLQVTQRSITFETQSAQKEYDGHPLIHPIYAVLIGALVDGHTAVIVGHTELVDVGIVDNVLTFKISDSEGNDVTANYAIHSVFQTLAVTPRPIAFQTVSQTKAYDGLMLRNPSHVVVFGALVAGHSTQTIQSAQRVDVGVFANDQQIQILAIDGRDVTANYDIRLESGWLEITPRPIQIQPSNSTKVYDGTALHSNTPVFLLGELVLGHRLEISTLGSQITVGTSWNDVERVQIWQDDVDVTANYAIQTMSGSLVVTRLPITIRLIDAIKVYDGTPLLSSDVSFPLGQMVAGHRLALANSGSQLVVGQSSNVILEAAILDGEVDMTWNYEMLFEEGTLEIQPRPIQIQSKDASKPYDGTPLTSNEVHVLLGSLVQGHHIDIVTSGTQTFAGSSTNPILEFHIWDGVVDVGTNYLVSCVFGSLEVTPRLVTIQTNSHFKIYDGTTLFDLGHEVVFGSLVAGHVTHVVRHATITSVGVADNLLDIQIHDAEGFDLTSNYAIQTIDGSLEVRPRPITIETYSSQKVYDGTPLWETTHAMVFSTLVDGHVTFVLEYTQLTGVGVVDNVLLIQILNSENQDVTANYAITYQTGSLEIIARELTIQTRSDAKIYDATPLSCPWWDILVGSLVPGHAIFVIEHAEKTDVGRIDNILMLQIRDGFGIDVTEHYAIQILNGTLEITARRIAIQTASDAKVYDATPLSHPGFGIMEGTLVSGHVAKVLFETAITNAGSVSNALTIRVYDAWNQDVSHNYQIDLDLGMLQVFPRPITIQTDSDAKEYDGTPLSDLHHVLLEGSLVLGHTTQVIAFEERWMIGEVANVLTIRIFDSNGQVVTDNYLMTFENGTLAVMPRSIELSTASAKKSYDGTPLVAPLWALTSGSLLPGHEWTVTVNGSITEIGKVFNGFDVQILDAEQNDVRMLYAITPNLGILEIQSHKVSLVIVSQSDSKTYDGLPLTNSDWFLKEGRLLPNHTIHVVVTGEITEIGQRPNAFSFIILDSEGNDVTDTLYHVRDIPGSLTVFDEDGNGTNETSAVSINASGDLSTGEFGPVLFQVFSPMADIMYLRDRSYGDYTKTGWNAPSLYETPSALSPLLFLRHAVGASQTSYEIRIKAFVGGLAYYLPYVSVDGMEGQFNDVFAAWVYGAGYQIRYVPWSVLSWREMSIGDSTILESELQYRSYVYQNYLQLPTMTKSSLLKIANDNGLIAQSPSLLEDVQNYILSVGLYNKAFKPIPSNVDYAVYFLETSREGICQHFAMAATVMYRALGIPARYVTGYAVATKENDWTDVTLSRAHAWVEVYIDALGWVPVEVTPGGPGGSGTGSGPGSGSGTGESTGLPNLERIEIFSSNAAKHYDGTPLTKEVYDWDGALKEGHVLNIHFTGTITQVGEARNTFTATIVDASGIDVSQEYRMEKHYGQLIVVPNNGLPILEFQVTRIQKTYDDTVVKHDPSDYWLLSNNLPDTYRIAVDIIGEIKLAGTLTTFIQKSTLRIYDENAFDVTNRYHIVCYEGAIQVVKRPITIRTFSAEKTYDGEPLTSNAYYIGKGSLAPGDVLNVVVSGTITQWGITQNTIDSIVIRNRFGEDVTDSYQIQTILGTLTVKHE